MHCCGIILGTPKAGITLFSGGITLNLSDKTSYHDNLLQKINVIELSLNYDLGMPLPIQYSITVALHISGNCRQVVVMAFCTAEISFVCL